MKSLLMSSKIKQNLPVILLFVFFASLYIYTAAPGVYDGDSGEIAAAVNTLGLAHPTGFPLYMITGKLFTLLVPIGDVAYRLNIFSALLTASALVFVYFILRNLGSSPFASLTSSFILGFGRNTIWQNSGTVNVYALSLLLATVLLFIFARWKEEQKIRHLYWYGFIWGLSLGTHAVMLIMGIPFLFMLWQAREKIKSKLSILSKIALITVIPGIQYIYLLFAYRRNAIVTWGSMASWNDFAYYITQRQYDKKIFSDISSYNYHFFNKLISLVVSELSIVFFIIALLGFVSIFRYNKALFSIFILVIASNILMMINYGNSAWDILILFRYIFIIYIILAMAAAFGIDAVINSRKLDKKWVSFLTLGIALFVFLHFYYSYSNNNRHDDYVMNDLADNILLTAESNSIIFTSKDWIGFPIYYKTSIKDYNIVQIDPELTIYDWYLDNKIKKYPDIISQSDVSLGQNYSRMDAIISRNISSKKIYTTFTAWDEYSYENFYFIPVGLLYRVVSKKMPEEDQEEIIFGNKYIWEKYNMRGLAAVHKNFMINQVIDYYANSLNNVGIYYFKAGHMSDALYFFEKSFSINAVDNSKINIEKTKQLIK